MNHATNVSNNFERGDVIEQLPTQEELIHNIAHVRATIAQAAERSGRAPDDITLIAVSKTKPVELVRMAQQLGVTDFGENRVQDALPKIAQLRFEGVEPIRWHMIGHVQTNKVNKIVGSFSWVQSVDSLRLAQALSRHAEELEQHISILLQVNVSGEQSKEGMTPEETLEIARQILALPYLDVQGLMTIAPLVQNVEKTRPVFRGLRELRDRLREQLPTCPWQHLSMGMTDDYPIAIEEGATLVRIGRAIFGERAPRNAV